MDKSVFIVMGVSGTGKTTIGKLLAEALKLPFFDGDDFHPEENILKMSAGQPLNDSDREGWLIALNELAIAHQSDGAIIACSALKEKYRQVLSSGIKDNIQFIFLEASFEQIKQRMQQRKDHFMPIELLQSQFDTLELPTEAIQVNVIQSTHAIVNQVLNQINKV